jgi:hypothetical protein
MHFRTPSEVHAGSSWLTEGHPSATGGACGGMGLGIWAVSAYRLQSTKQNTQNTGHRPTGPPHSHAHAHVLLLLLPLVGYYEVKWIRDPTQGQRASNRDHRPSTIDSAAHLVPRGSSIDMASTDMASIDSAIAIHAICIPSNCTLHVVTCRSSTPSSTSGTWIALLL